MEFIRLKDSENESFLKAMELYEISFPVHEQRVFESQKDIMSESEYHFELIFSQEKFAGIVLNWETENFIYIEHFCVKPELRGCGLGQRVLICIFIRSLFKM